LECLDVSVSLGRLSVTRHSLGKHHMQSEICQWSS